MKQFKKIFSAPVFDDEVKNQQAYMLNVILWALICVPIPYVLYVAWAEPENFARAMIQAVFGETVNIILQIMLRRGYVKAASVIQVSAFWFFFTATALTGSGIQGGAYMLGHGLVIAIAGILLGGLGASIFTFLSLAAGAWMVYSQQHGILAYTFTGSSPLTVWVMSFVLFTVGAVLQNLAANNVKTALARARSSEEKYRLISQVISDYTFATEVHKDGSASLSWVAGAFEKMTGYTFEEYVASGSWLAHVHPDDLEKDERDMEKLNKNQDIKSEIRTFTKNGEIRWEQIFAHPVWDEKENRLIGIIGAVQDVTEQKQIEMALQKILFQQAAILNNIPDMAWLKDRESRYIAVNEQFSKTAGMLVADIVGKTDIEIWQNNFAEKYRSDDLEVMQSRQRKNTEEIQRDGDGREYWIETTKIPILNAEHEVIGTTGIAREITERKQVQEAEHQRRVMLEKVIRLGKLVNELDDIRSTIKKIWYGIRDDLLFDRLEIYLFNTEENRMDKTFGTDKHGEILDEWHVTHPIGAIFKSLLQNPDGIYFTLNYDTDNNLPKSHENYGVKDYVAVAAWAGEKPVAVICADHSITQRPISPEQVEALRLFGGYAGLAIENARLNTTLKDDLNHRKTLIKKLEAKNAELERFTYTVSHDLKSPLVTILGFLGYLEKDARQGNFEKFKHDTKRIETAVGKMQNLLRDLLELSRVGMLMSPSSQMSFNELVKDAIEILDGQIKEKNITIEYKENSVIVNCDRVRVTEVLQNLIDNATKFMGSQPDPRIEIGVMGGNENIFYVKDNGIGIAPEFQENIFGLFNKLIPESDGTGVGLALVKRIIETHGGRIWVESQVGKGTTFYFTLP